MRGMLARWIKNRLEKAITQTPAVVLLGSRQVGKTTLAKMVREERSSIYLDLGTPEDVLKLSNPSDYLTDHGDKLIILDEIQRVPNLFMVLRSLIDKNKERGHKHGQFLLLGSASPDLLRQSSESLAGRISYIEMGGFNVLETKADSDNPERLWLRGGFPDSYLAPSDDSAMDWLEDLIRTYLERDVPQISFKGSASELRRLWIMLAHLQGQVVNVSKLASSLEVQQAAINHYIDILVDLLLARRLQPWYINVKKRLVKSPRCYIRDSGIQHRLLGIDTCEALLSYPALGKSWEGFVIENIHSVLPRRAETYFYYTAAGAEIDLVIKFSFSEIWAVEIKYSEYNVASKLSKHYNRACEDVGATKKYIVYGGNDEFSIGDDVVVISLSKLMQKLARYR